MVEVVSRASPMRDRLVKRELYARNGIPAYWIADPAGFSIEILALAGSRYAAEAWFEDEQTLVTERMPDLGLPLLSVFR